MHESQLQPKRAYTHALVQGSDHQCLLDAEDRVGRMIIQCERLRSPLLLQSLCASYAEGTGGLSCLCRWPTRYPRCVYMAFRLTVSIFQPYFAGFPIPAFNVCLSSLSVSSNLILPQVYLGQPDEVCKHNQHSLDGSCLAAVRDPLPALAARVPRAARVTGSWGVDDARKEGRDATRARQRHQSVLLCAMGYTDPWLSMHERLRRPGAPVRSKHHSTAACDDQFWFSYFYLCYTGASRPCMAHALG